MDAMTAFVEMKSSTAADAPLAGSSPSVADRAAQFNA